MGASASQPWHHPNFQGPEPAGDGARARAFPCLVSRRAAHVVVVGEKVAASPNPHPPIFLSRARKQQAPKSACMTLPVRRLDTSVAHVVYRRHHSQLTTTTHRRPSPRPACCGRTSQCPPSPHHPPLTPLCPCPGVAWLHPAVRLVCRGPAGAVGVPGFVVVAADVRVLSPGPPSPSSPPGARCECGHDVGPQDKAGCPYLDRDAVGTTCYLGAFPSSPSRPSLSFEHDPNLYIFHICRGFAQTFVLRPPTLGVVPLEVLR